MTQVMERTISDAALAGLRASLRGPVVARGDATYEDVRRIWNGAIDRRPAAFARCTGVADVIAALRFAREHGLEVAVRGGGHNVAGTALTDGGVVIDLQLMRGMRVDPHTRRIVAQPGLRLGDVDHETQSFGLALVAGINSETGLAGLTLGGGIGWLMRKHGLTIDHLVGADVVTADGALVRASREEHTDLFWALRGGGGNFGIVTSFEFGLVELGPSVRGGIVLYPAERAREILRAYRDWANVAAEEVTTISMLRLAPASPWIPEDVRGKPVLGIGALYAGPAEDGAAALEPLSRFGPILATSMAVRSFAQHQSMLDGSSPAGRLYYWKSHYLRGLDDATIDAIVDGAWRFSSPYSYTLLSHMGGAIGRRSDDDSAFTGRDAPFAINMNCVATEQNVFERDRDWVRGWFDALTPHSAAGAYVNFIGEEGTARVRAAYGDQKYGRLAEIKARYDPANVFRVNQNIVPR